MGEEGRKTVGGGRQGGREREGVHSSVMNRCLKRTRIDVGREGRACDCSWYNRTASGGAAPLKDTYDISYAI